MRLICVGSGVENFGPLACVLRPCVRVFERGGDVIGDCVLDLTDVVVWVRRICDGEALVLIFLTNR